MPRLITVVGIFEKKLISGWTLVNADADIEAGARDYPDNRVFNATPLIVAAQQGHTKVAEVLINAGANVYAEMHDSGGWDSAIH